MSFFSHMHVHIGSIHLASLLLVFTRSASHRFSFGPLHNSLQRHFSLVKLVCLSLGFRYSAFAPMSAWKHHISEGCWKNLWKTVSNNSINRAEEGKGSQNKATAKHAGNRNSLTDDLRINRSLLQTNTDKIRSWKALIGQCVFFSSHSLSMSRT